MNWVNSSILLLQTSNFLTNSTIHFCMFLYFVPCFLRVMVSLLCQSQAVSKIHVPIYPYLISEGRQNCLSCWLVQQQNCNSQETLTNIEACVNCLRFSENLSHCDEIVWVNLICFTKSTNLLWFCVVLGSDVMLTFLNLLPMHSPFIEKSVIMYHFFI